MFTQRPSSDETSVSKKQLLAGLDICMGGRVAEELIFGKYHITTGASGDLLTATELAQYMVSNCGMSESIGPIHIKERPSAEMQPRIDAKHEKALHALANALLEYETRRRNKKGTPSISSRKSFRVTRARGRRQLGVGMTPKSTNLGIAATIMN